MIDKNVLKDAVMYAFNEAMKKVGYNTTDIKPIKISFSKSYKGSLLAKLIVKLGNDISYTGYIKPSDEWVLFEFSVPSDSDMEVDKYMFEDDIDDLVKRLKRDFAYTTDITNEIKSSNETVDEIIKRISRVEKEYNCKISFDKVMPGRKGFPVRMFFQVDSIEIAGILFSAKIRDAVMIDGENIRNLGSIKSAIARPLDVNVTSPSDVDSTFDKIESWLDTIVENTRKAINDVKKCIKIVHDNEHIVEEGCDKIENLLQRRGLRNPSVTYTPNFDFATPYVNDYMFLIEVTSDNGFKTKYRIGSKEDVRSAMDSIYSKIRRNSNRFIKKPSDELSDILI